jgi:hypothetical protein
MESTGLGIECERKKEKEEWRNGMGWRENA